MTGTEPLEPLRPAITALARWLNAAQARYAVIGGIAANLHANPRTTRDVDGMVRLEPKDAPRLLASAGQFEIQPRIADPLAFAERSRVLLLKHAPSGIPIDLSLSNLFYEDNVLGRARSLSLWGLKVPVITTEDLIVMKSIAHRARDLGDIEELIAAHPKLNRRYMCKWLRQFSELLEMPEIEEDVEHLLKRKARRPAAPGK